MGQKVNPISFRLVVNKNWRSKWFNEKNYRENLLGDISIRRAISKKLGRASAIDFVEILRDQQQIAINIYTARPGIIIGRSGQGINDLSTFILKSLQKDRKEWSYGTARVQEENSTKNSKLKLKINIMEVRNPESHANLIAQNVASQLEKRVAYRRAVKMSLEKAMQIKEVKGIKIGVAGRLGGVEIARREKFSRGSIPLSTLRANVDFAHQDAFTTYGTIGVKVWVYKI